MLRFAAIFCKKVSVSLDQRSDYKLCGIRIITIVFICVLKIVNFSL